MGLRVSAREGRGQAVAPLWFDAANKADLVSASTESGSDSFSKTETTVAYGIGLQYAINKALSVRAEAESFAHLRPGDSFEKRNVNLYRIGLCCKFCYHRLWT